MSKEKCVICEAKSEKLDDVTRRWFWAPDDNHFCLRHRIEREIRASLSFLRQKNPLRWYRQSEKRKQIIAQAAAFVTFGQIAMNILYILGWPYRFTLNPIEWNALIFSADTSIAAMYYALYGLWKYYTAIDAGKKEIYDRLGVPFIRNLAEFGKRLDKRWSEMTPEQRAHIISLIDKIVDRGFDRVAEIANMPRPKRKRVKKL